MLDTIMMIIFWVSIFMVVWSYFGYLIFLKVLSLFYRKKVIKEENYAPEISIVITAYNEEKRIAEKLNNTLKLNYPAEKREIIVVTDGCSDRTVEIVKAYAERGVKLLEIPERHGKHYGQGKGIHRAEHEIVILTDATTFLPEDAVEKIVSNFADPDIGCVSSEDQMKSSTAESSGEGIYVKYEMLLRRLESKVGSLVGVSGCFFAVRKKLCWEWIDNMSADFYMPSVTRLYGQRTVLDPEAKGLYEVVQDPSKEFQRKVRTVVHGLEVFFTFKAVLNFFRYGFYSFQMLSHKLSRWLVPLFLVTAFISNLFLFDNHLIYPILLLVQLMFYFMATLAFIFRPLQDIILFKIPFFFAMVNLSIVVAWYKYLTHQEYVVWDSTKR